MKYNIWNKTDFALIGSNVGFQLSRIRLDSPSEIEALEKDSSSLSKSMFSLGPGVKSLIQVNVAVDETRALGKIKPVSQFSFNGSVFVTFREPGHEFREVEEFQERPVSRIAKICRQDRGVDKAYSSVKYWTSYAKARIVCSSKADKEFTSIQDTLMFPTGSGFMFAIFTPTFISTRSSAICVFDLKGMTFNIHKFLKV